MPVATQRHAGSAPSPLRHLLLLTLVICAAAALTYGPDLARWQKPSLAISSLAVSAAAYAYVTLSSPRGFWSIPSLFMLVALCFHEGTLVYAAAGTSPVFEGQTGKWFSTYEMKQSIVAVTLAFVVFALVAGKSSKTVIVPQQHHVHAVDQLSARFGMVGVGILACATLTWFAFTVTALGPAFVLSSYDVYLAHTTGQPLAYVFYGIGVGLVLAVASDSSRWRRCGLALFALFAVAALPLGLRGEVLFPAVAGAAILARTRSMPRKVFVILLVLGLLTGINAIQQTRRSGLGQARLNSISATPLQGLAELGGTLRTVSAVITWREEDGPNSLRHGATYIAPFDRFINGRILGHPMPTSTSDMRLFNVEMRARETTIGGSFIAEAYRNFGVVGLLLIPGLIGGLLRFLESRRSSIVSNAIAGVVLVALLQHVRNSFAPLPAEVFLGLLMILLLNLICEGRRTATSYDFGGVRS